MGFWAYFCTVSNFVLELYDLWGGLEIQTETTFLDSRRCFRGPGCHRSLKDLDVRDMTPKIGVEIRSKSTQLFAWRLEKLWGLHKMKFSLNILCWTEKKADNLRDREMEWVLHLSWSKYFQYQYITISWKQFWYIPLYWGEWFSWKNVIVHDNNCCYHDKNDKNRHSD